MRVMYEEWRHAERFQDAAYLRTVQTAVYVMQSRKEQDRFRSGSIGITAQNNNAWARLNQLNAGDLKQYAPWSFVFLAPLPWGLGSRLGTMERALQKRLGERFNGGRRGQRDMFRCSDISAVQAVASECLSELLGCSRGDAKMLDEALNRYIHLMKSGAEGPLPFDAWRDVQAARADVILAFSDCLNPDIAQKLLREVGAGSSERGC